MKLYNKKLSGGEMKVKISKMLSKTITEPNFFRRIDKVLIGSV